MGIFDICNLAILFTICLNSVLSQPPANSRHPGHAGFTATAPNTCQAGDMGPKCADCNTLLTCIGSTTEASQSCSTIDINRPYCVDDTCSASTTELCISESFKCTGEGQFPDPHDCSRYFVCDQINGNAYVYACPFKTSYDSKTGLCKRTPCQQIDCSRSPNKYVVYAADPSLMAYCRNTPTINDVILFRCPDSTNMQYDNNTLKCVYKCSTEGRFADRLDCHSFYDCYNHASLLIARRQTCPTGYSFDQISKVCIKQAECTNEIGSTSPVEPPVDVLVI